MPPPRVSVRDVELRVTDCDARLPFRFGAATITWAPLLTARVTADVDGERSVGFSADLTMPRWFDKDPERSVADDIGALTGSALAAGLAYRGADSASVFDTWLAVYRERSGGPGVPLVIGFGTALVERALIDATCRAAGVSFFEALKTDLLGMRAGAVHAELADWDLAASLPDKPLDRVLVRHTIGLLDPLRTDEVADADRVDDGLPQSLEEDVRRYGLRAFKVKIGGDPEADARRLDQLGEFLPSVAGADYMVTLDANEQYTDLTALGDLLERTSPAFVERIAFVEQPFSRATSFDSSVAGLTKAVILDEADGSIDDFPRALSCGYRGVSVKNCKGVFRALLNRGLCDVRHGAFQSAEDLTNLPVLSLQQDLATVAALGLTHVERNGHHYFRGLDHLPPAEVEAALAAHPELYERRDGGITLGIRNGKLDLSSLQAPGYGYACPIEFEARTPLSAWRPR
jgi:L-alanine-DL-glutamate epimerase-like enolase superfamily enzyme